MKISDTHKLKLYNNRMRVVLKIVPITLFICFAVFGFTNKAQAVIRLGAPDSSTLTDGLVGYWPLDGSVTNWNTNTTLDLSGKGDTGTLLFMSLSTSPTLGKIGQALKFSGSLSEIDIPYNTAYDTTNASVSYWMKESVPANNQETLVSRIYDGTGIPYFSDMRGLNNQSPTFGTYDSRPLQGGNHVVSANAEAVVGRWMHVVGTFDGTAYRIYINGVLDNTLVDSQPFYPGPTNSLAIGNLSGNGRTFKGTIDEVRVYNRALSAAEVMQLYKMGTAQVGHANTSTVSNGLVGYWPLDGSTINWSTGKATDLTGNGNTGLLTAMSTSSSPVAGKIGQAISFNGVSYIASTDLDTPNTMSVSLWFKTTNQANQYLIGKDSSTSWMINVGGILAFWTGGAFTSTGAVADGTWHHVVGTFANGVRSVYLDGVLAGRDTGQTLGTDNFPLDIGRTGSTAILFKGSLDDVRIYNRALSDTEVKQLYGVGAANIGHANTSLGATGLVGYWPFDGSTINWATGKAQDLSSQGNAASLRSLSTTTTPVAGKIGQALNFAGTGFVRGPDVSSLFANDFSISFWIKEPSVSGDEYVAATYQGGAGNWVGIRTSTNVHLLTFVGPAVISYFSFFPGTSWHHITGTRDSTTGLMVLYVDGVAVGSAVGTTGAYILSGGNTIFDIGGNYASGFFNGTMDDVRIYNRALSATEVKQLYNTGS